MPNRKWTSHKRVTGTEQYAQEPLPVECHRPAGAKTSQVTSAYICTSYSHYTPMCCSYI